MNFYSYSLGARDAFEKLAIKSEAERQAVMKGLRPRPVSAGPAIRIPVEYPVSAPVWEPPKEPMTAAGTRIPDLGLDLQKFKLSR